MMHSPLQNAAQMYLMGRQMKNERMTKDLSGKALMGDPEAQAQLMQVNPQMALQVQSQLQQQQAQQAQQEQERQKFLIDNKTFVEKYLKDTGTMLSGADPEKQRAIMESRVGDLKKIFPEQAELLGLNSYEYSPEMVEGLISLGAPSQQLQYKDGVVFNPKTGEVTKTDLYKEGAELPTSTREFNDLLEKATSDDELTRQAARIKLGLDPRAVGSSALTVTALGNAPEVADTESVLAAGKEAGKLSAQLKLQPKVKEAVETASRGAAALADRAVKTKDNLDTFDVYNIGMNGVAEALGNTETGPFVGRLPAITSDQQIAEGTIAAMAPVLKQMFRAAGEGAFTDYDQKLLLDMMPTRKDTPEAVQGKLQNIDAIVRSKLGVPVDYGADKPVPIEAEVSDIEGMSDDDLMKSLGL